MSKMNLKEQFIELRAEGASFDSCARELGKSKTTLIKWQRELDTEIENMKYLNTQYILEKYKITNEKKIEFYSEQLDRIHKALAKINYEELSVKDLLALKEKFENCLEEETRSIKYKTGEITETNMNESMMFDTMRTEETLPL
ncbi:hypothetical protein GF337_19255 [candidate division KSB1 bacterium]|nr:hypothetical protein [candidate division KSB1 bacterium]